MDSKIGEEGTILNYYDNIDSFLVKFNDKKTWYYPVELVVEQFIIKEKTKDELFNEVFSEIHKLVKLFNHG
jgi:hypothetical protein